MEHYPQFNESWQEEEQKKEETEERSLLQDIARAAVGVLLIVAMLWLAGGYNIFRFRETPSSVEQAPIASKVDARELTVPLNIIVLRSDGDLGAERSEENIRVLVKKAANIWSQANIELAVTGIRERTTTDGEIFSSFLNPGKFKQLAEYEQGTVNVILSKRIPGSVNGVAYGGLDTITVAEVTTTFDFRTFAHEIGHQLGLGHIPGRGNLMSSGANGNNLSIEEIITARTHAGRFQK